MRKHSCTKTAGNRLSTLKHLVPVPVRQWLRSRQKAAQKSLIHLDRVTDWSVLRRVQPYRPEFGGRRGQYIDRFYIEQFLAAHQECIRGRVAEMESPQYTQRFGAGRVLQSDVLDINESNTLRTMTVDLARPEEAPENLLDCFLCTQTIFLIRDYAAAIRAAHKMLKPGGTLLATVPGISPRVPQSLVAGAGEDWWRFTARSARLAFGAVFGEDRVDVRSYGNVLTTTAFLQGLVQEELTQDELAYNDPDFELILGIKAVKSASA